MKSVGSLTLCGVAACLFAGCGGSTGDSAKEVHHPKHPDLFVTIYGADGHSGGAVWYEQDDGYETYSTARDDSAKDGTRVVCKPVYVGSTDAGDTYELEVTVGDAKGTKSVVYEGERMELDLADGVTFVLEPDPL